MFFFPCGPFLKKKKPPIFFFFFYTGQPCRVEQDCVAYHYSNLYNVSLKPNICSSEYCNPESKCDGAWDQKDFFLPKFDKPSTCCDGLESESKCDIVATDVDPCDYRSDCNYNSGKCVDVNQKQHIWIGILICLLGGVAANIGLNIQKYAFTKQEELDRKQQQMMTDALDDDTSSKKNLSISNVSTTNNLEHSSLYRKLEPFMFLKQIIVSPVSVLKKKKKVIELSEL